jgi:hypothetical protein
MLPEAFECVGQKFVGDPVADVREHMTTWQRQRMRRVALLSRQFLRKTLTMMPPFP